MGRTGHDRGGQRQHSPLWLAASGQAQRCRCRECMRTDHKCQQEQRGSRLHAAPQAFCDCFNEVHHVLYRSNIRDRQSCRFRKAPRTPCGVLRTFLTSKTTKARLFFVDIRRVVHCQSRAKAALTYIFWGVPMRSFSFRLAFSAVAVLSFAVRGSAQSTATLTQTVGQRPTIGVLSATPTSGYTAGAPVTFSYILHTAGAPAPTTESVQFLDGTTVIGSQVIGSVAGSNLLPYSQISLANGWSQTGTAANLDPASVAGPDGSANTATQASFPDTTSGTSGIQFSVPGTSYANQPMTFSVWARAAAATTLNLSLSDSQSVSASGSSTCALTTAWQRCVLTYSFPANAGSGFSAAVSVSGTVAQAVSLWGAQVEKASAAGPYVSTIGTARGSSAYGGSVTFPYSMFQAGSHTISVLYGGDNNLLASIQCSCTESYESYSYDLASEQSVFSGGLW